MQNILQEQTDIEEETVFDLDAILKDPSAPLVVPGISKFCSDSLGFESRFESGNLRKSIRVSLNEYNLLLTPDVNSAKHHQWFYFEVSKMKAGVPYTFNIINYEKANSQYNFGMQPLLFSSESARNGNPEWTRAGQDVLYYKNHYAKTLMAEDNYMTASFTVTFPYSDDICYLAYHFPYTYSQLLVSKVKFNSMV